MPFQKNILRGANGLASVLNRYTHTH